MSGGPETIGTAALAEHVIAIRRSPARGEELVALLAEQSPIYRGLDTRDAERIRGFIFAGFETTGLPQGALPFVLAELETGINPYTVAAAAKALRGAAEISDRVFAVLVAAARRIAGKDDMVQYGRIDPGDRAAPRSSALAEILRSIAAAGPRARPLWQPLEAMAARGNVCTEAMAALEQALAHLSAEAGEHCCCEAPPPLEFPAKLATAPDIDDLALEDQSGETFSYRDFFHGRPSVVTFFYTRCMNPQKCSLTISKLGALQRRFAAIDGRSRINIAAFTYDPAYDRGRRLQIYGAERGFRFDAQNRFIRTVGSFEPIRARFDLGVGYGPATVNQHSIELLILDAGGEPIRDYRRMLWNEFEIADAVKGMVDPAPARRSAS
jgi:cytochrome oxidase Cu insertion factor (SCO1/SenC/PrrC family)